MQHKILYAAMLLTGLACKNSLVSPLDQSPPAAADAAGDVQLMAQVHNYHVLFNGGTDGYHSYRIPSIIRTNNGTLIAFCEGRMANNKDYGNINLVYKRSFDNGATWTGLDEVVGKGLGTWGNPTAVTD